MKYYRLILLSIFSLFILNSCLEFETIFPYGNITSHQRPVNRTFDQVYISNGFELILTQSNNNALVVETNENLHPYIVTEIVGNKLRIYLRRNLILGRGSKVKIFLDCNYLDNVSASGGSKILLTNLWIANSLDFHISGGGSLYGDVDLLSMYISLSGGSKADLAGYADELRINSSGGSKTWFSYLESEHCNANISGGGYAEIFAKQHLTVNASGGSKLFFRGNPYVVTNLSGGSFVGRTR